MMLATVCASVHSKRSISLYHNVFPIYLKVDSPKLGLEDSERSRYSTVLQYSSQK